jgi:hypothetical protein
MQVSEQEFRSRTLDAVRRAATEIAKAVQSSGTVFAVV